MREVYSNITKVMIDAHNSTNLLQLPLDRLLQQAAAAAPAGAAATPPAAMGATDPAPATATDDPRSRDNQRSREREKR